MKFPTLLALLVLISSAAQADNVSSPQLVPFDFNSPVNKKNREEVAAREAAAPITALDLFFLDNPDKSLSRGYKGHYSKKVYLWSGVIINQKSIPGLNSIETLSQSPVSIPYDYWSKWEVHYLEPVKSYWFDPMTRYYISGYPDTDRTFFFRLNERPLPPSELPTGAVVVEMKKPLLIPIVKMNAQAYQQFLHFPSRPVESTR